ncbi:hypothetical protein WMF45_18325 [Sorangium sp. So ce448]|uniref:hypothetical protein n=1 Tax=Sorangium sp. So ce448 TaxID=3133314 RepID=UPI003F5EF213
MRRVEEGIMQAWMHSVGALVLTGGMVAALVPACTIHLRPSDGDEIEDESAEHPPSARPDEDSESETDDDDVEDDQESETMSPEAEAAYDELMSIDPQEVALKTMATSYAAVMVASLVETQVVDPAALDLEALDALIQQYAPAGWDSARLWIETPEATTLAATDGVYPDFACFNEPYGCPQTTECPLSNGEQAFCMVTHCGTGECPWCPWGLGNILFKSWCAYGCLKNGNLVAGAYILVSSGWGPGKRQCTYW